MFSAVSSITLSTHAHASLLRLFRRPPSRPTGGLFSRAALTSHLQAHRPSLNSPPRPHIYLLPSTLPRHCFVHNTPDCEDPLAVPGSHPTASRPDRLRSDFTSLNEQPRPPHRSLRREDGCWSCGRPLHCSTACVLCRQLEPMRCMHRIRRWCFAKPCARWSQQLDILASIERRNLAPARHCCGKKDVDVKIVSGFLHAEETIRPGGCSGRRVTRSRQSLIEAVALWVRRDRSAVHRPAKTMVSP